MNGSSIDSGAAEMGGDESESTTELRLDDPHDYNLTRTLRKLHNAQESPRERKEAAHRLAELGEIADEVRDALVAEEVVSYVRTLQPVLAKRNAETEDTTLEDELLAESIRVGGVETTVGDFVESRGRVDGGDGWDDEAAVADYSVSMDVWHVTNRYFQRIAGVVFDRQAGPEDNPVDPAGRLTHE